MSAAARLRSLIHAWETVRYELLNTRLCDLNLRLSRSPILPALNRLRKEFHDHRIGLAPAFYITDGWGCPNRVPVIGIPFYLADKRLMRIEEEQTGEIEDEQMVMMLLRHEAGHAVNYAYRLWEEPEWGELFGRFAEPYRDTFDTDPFSRRFVRHLAHGQARRTTYAQKHPDEDFAETFAVWLTPKSGWRRRYANWPALRKLAYVDRVMRRLRTRIPAVTGGELMQPVETLAMTVAEHYGQRAERYRSKAQGYLDDKLKRVFPQFRAPVPAVEAATFITRRRRMLITRVADWSAMAPEDIRMLLDKVVERARSLGLRVRMDQQEERLMDLASLLTAMAVTFRHTGKFME
jgi:hypothetical protein